MENIKEFLTLEEVQTFRSRKGREVIGLLIGHLGDNHRGTTTLIFPDIDRPDDPFWWYLGSKDECDSSKSQNAEIIMTGSISFRKGHVIEVELDYEGGHMAKRLKILSAQGVAFFAEYEGVVPKWMQAKRPSDPKTPSED